MTAPELADRGCPSPAFPGSTVNPAGATTIRYRIGDFLTLRDALLQPLPNETALTNWVPRTDGDLALQLVDWWAYIGDVLTFYGERIASESYLRTAQLPESVTHLAQTLGYRPRPALGASANLAALLANGARVPVTVPAGTQILSKPGPGAAPQTFEVSAATAVTTPDVVIAAVVPARSPLLALDAQGHAVNTLWLAGKVSGIKPGDHLLIAPTSALTGGATSPQAWIVVGALHPAKDPLGKDVTALDFTVVAGSLTAGLSVGDFALLRPRQSAPLWTFGGTAITTTSVDLAGVARGLGAGALMLLDVAPDTRPRSREISLPWALPEGVASREGFVFNDHEGAVLGMENGLGHGHGPHPGYGLGPGNFGTIATTVTGYSESVWYANGSGATPPAAPAVPIGMMHATVAFSEASIVGDDVPQTPLVTVRWDWTSVGTLAAVLTPADYTTATSTTIAVDPLSKQRFPASSASVMVEDATGVADKATFKPAGAGGTLSGLSRVLTTPISVFFTALPVSRGKTVAREVLGSGDTRVGGQDFVLAKAPVTYFTDPASQSGDQFSSTVAVSVNGVAWAEARSFFGASVTDTIYVLREDDLGNTHVQFGDGTNGARLPTGTNNVVASYRHGAGADAPASETLTSVLTPVQGLKGVANPLSPTGGADADPPARIRQLAPASVLTLGRVVSLDDYAATAMTVGGVRQAAASFSIDPASQRPKVVVTVAGDAGVSAAVRKALQSAGANGAELVVVPAFPVTARITVAYLRDPRYADDDVSARIRASLCDPDTGLLGANTLTIGQAIYDSQIAAACAAVTGVTAVAAISFATVETFVPEIVFKGTHGWSRFGDPPAPSARHDPGPGAYFVVPANSDHVVLTGQPSRSAAS